MDAWGVAFAPVAREKLCGSIEVFALPSRTIAISAAIACLGEPHLHVGTFFEVNTVDEPDAARFQRHDYRGSTDAFAEVAHAPHQRAVSDAGGCEDHLVAGGEILGFVNTVLVLNAHPGDALLEFGLVDHETPEHVAVQTANGGGRDHPFGSAAGSHDAVDARADDGSRDAGGKIA